MRLGHFPPEPKKFEPTQPVYVARVVGWGARPADRTAVLATIVVATPQFGDTYLVEYPDGKRDVIDVNRIEAA